MLNNNHHNSIFKEMLIYMIFGNEELYLESSQGDMSMKVGDYKGALEHYSKAIQLDPNNDGLWNQKGLAYLQLAVKNNSKSKYKDAIKCFNKSINLNKRSFAPWNNKGLVYRNVGKHKKAIECFLRAVSIDPDEDKGWANLGKEYYMIGKYNTALRQLSKAILSNENNGEAWRYKGKVLRAQGKYKKALKSFEKSMFVNPQIESVPLTDKIITLTIMGRFEEAIESCNELKTNGFDFVADNLMGEIYIEKGNFNEALKCFNRYISNGHIILSGEFLDQNITKDEIWNNVGTAFKGKKQYNSAIQAYKKSLKSNQNQPDIKKEIERIKSKIESTSQEYDQSEREIEELDEHSNISSNVNKYYEGATLNKLEELKEMKKRGLITEEEYEKKKKGILDNF